MTLAAGAGNIHLRDCRLLIRRRLDVMSVMTVGANGGAHVPARDGFGVDALAIREYRLIADAAALHHGLISMTTSAGLGDIGAVDRRFGITRRQDRRHVAIFGVAIKTSSSLRTVLF